jgi:hypothetical protein
MFKRSIAGLVLVFAVLFGISSALAQSVMLDLPRPSQHAIVTQRVGITDITINYHRPLVNKREVWGKLVPYGQVWRAGANENTTIAFSDSVSIEGKPLAKGVYGLHMIPGENEWTIIFSNAHTAWGSFTYKQDADALRVTVKPQAAEFREALTYDFDDVKSDSTVATLRWEKVSVPFTVNVNVHDIVQASLHNQLQGLSQYFWEGGDDAANYLLAEKYDLDEALKYEDASIQNEERFDNLMTKSQILDALNRKDDAKAARTKAIAMGNIQQLHGYGRQLQAQGQQDQAFEIFRMNIKKDPNHWLSHGELARMACAKGDFDTAVKEMKVSEAGAPDQAKPFMASLVKRLEAKENINK